MSVPEAILYGIMQGLTEFLPVSSSGHLELMKHYFDNQDVPRLFDIILHTATLLAVCIVFFPRLARIFGAVFRKLAGKAVEGDDARLRVFLMIILSTVVTGLLALTLELLDIKLPIIGVYVCFLLTGLVLLATRFFAPEKKSETISIPGALLVGLAQGIGIFPGISRSGITISTSLFTGLSRKEAGEYSFLISIPAILLALAWDILKGGQDLGSVMTPAAVAAGFAASFAVGFGALLLLLRLVRSGKFYLFSIYLIPLAIFGLVTTI